MYVCKRIYDNNMQMRLCLEKKETDIGTSKQVVTGMGVHL